MGLFVEDTGGGAPFYLEGVTVTNPNGTGLCIAGDNSPCSVRLASCAISDCRSYGVTATGSRTSLSLVDCLVLRNGRSGVWAGCRLMRISGASSRIHGNGGRGLFSAFGSSIKVSGLGTKPAFTRQDQFGQRIFSGATTSALFSETEDHPNKDGDVAEYRGGSVVFLS